MGKTVKEVLSKRKEDQKGKGGKKDDMRGLFSKMKNKEC